MTIYKRPDNTIFAESAQSGEVVAFENMPRGWGVTLDSTKGIPPMEWFNFLQNRTDKAIQYILQNGITEYDTNLEYPQNAVVKSGGKLYLCLRQNTNKPLSNGAYWELLIKNATTSQKGVVQLSNEVDGTDETKASTPKATKTAYDKAVQAYDNANKAQQRADSAYNLATTKENKITRSDSVTSNSSVNVATSKAVKTVNDKANKLEQNKLDKSALSSSVTSTDETKASTPKATKVAYDKAVQADNNANSRVSKNGDIMTGRLEINAGNYSSVVLGSSSNNNKLLIETFDNSISNDVILKFILRENNIYNKNRAIVSIPNKFGIVLLDSDIDNSIDSTNKQKVGSAFAVKTAYDKANDADEKIRQLRNMLIGIPYPYPSSTIPPNHLAINGQRFNTRTYPELAKKYPSGQLPDMRGLVIRGLDNGRGYDSGRSLLSEQGDAIRNIMGSFSSVDVNDDQFPDGVFSLKSKYEDVFLSRSVTNYSPFKCKDYLCDIDLSRTVPTANENRMKNIAFNYICLAR